MTMAALAQELHQIMEQEEALASRKAVVQAEMRKVARLLAGEDDAPIVPSIAASPLRPMRGRPLGARDKQLLRLLRDTPDSNYGAFAIAMFGEDTPKKRANVASKFSNLKKSGHVETRGPGIFKLTEMGVEAAE